MLHIKRITLREIRLALKEPFRISSGVMTERRIALVELEDASGVIGWSECVADELPNYSPETIETCWLAISEWLAPRVLGRRIEKPELVHTIIDENIRGHSMAKAAVEMGAWELASRIDGVPLSKKLGGTRDRVITGISIGIQATPDALAERARKAHALGYKKIKLKIQRGSDIEFVRAVREALGDEVHLMADANSGYTIADIDHLVKLDEFNLIMLEQPFGRDDLLRHAQLQKRMRTPICLDETIVDVERAEDMITLQAARIINIKPGRVGGFTTSKAIHDLCQRNNVPVWCGGMFESGIGRGHNVALASLPNFVLPGDLSPSSRYWDRDIVKPEWTMDAEGMVHVPLDKPGIGVAIDFDRIDDLTIRRQDLVAKPEGRSAKADAAGVA